MEISQQKLHQKSCLLFITFFTKLWTFTSSKPGTTLRCTHTSLLFVTTPFSFFHTYFLQVTLHNGIIDKYTLIQSFMKNVISNSASIDAYINGICVECTNTHRLIWIKIIGNMHEHVKCLSRVALIKRKRFSMKNSKIVFCHSEYRS